jgi:hypothetical protein
MATLVTGVACRLGDEHLQEDGNDGGSGLYMSMRCVCLYIYTYVCVYTYVCMFFNIRT